MVGIQGRSLPSRLKLRGTGQNPEVAGCVIPRHILRNNVCATLGKEFEGTKMMPGSVQTTNRNEERGWRCTEGHCERGQDGTA